MLSVRELNFNKMDILHKQYLASSSKALKIDDVFQIDGHVDIIFGTLNVFSRINLRPFYYLI